MLQTIDHVNLVVRDLEKMTRFYCDVLGLVQTKCVTISGPWIEQVVGLEKVEAKVIYLDPPRGPRIELIEYVSPPSDRPAKLEQPHTQGLRHLAFCVTDIEQAAKALEHEGVRLIGKVQKVPNTQVTYEGQVSKRLIYFYDPEHNLLELCEYR